MTITFDNTFDQALHKISGMHAKKSADYADPSNRFSNFEEAAVAAGISVEQGFEYIIGIKQARIKQLLQPMRIPQNESLEDSLLDRATYAVLAYAYFMQKNKVKTSNPNDTVMFTPDEMENLDLRPIEMDEPEDDDNPLGTLVKKG